MKVLKAVLFKSKERFSNFQKTLLNNNVELAVLDFNELDWVTYDYTNIDFIIYYPSFTYSSNHPLSLQHVYDNLAFLFENYPHLKIYPDPGLIKYYNDKYRQFLFLSKHGFSIPKTIPLFSKKALDLADTELGYPMVIKNRFGAGGGAVFRVNNKRELTEYYNLSTLNLFNFGSFKYYTKMFSKRITYYNLIKARQLSYPFLSPPLLAQKFIAIDKDLKTVIGNCKIVEGHWRLKANKDMWKMNIDDGGIGEWSYIPQEAIELSIKLARITNSSWINIDIINSGNDYYISEFSPVWHHYRYKEKPNFVYKEDYNVDVPLEISLDLESILVKSLIGACNK
jgi:glutathione synthase/RimK-type ligase-like ATP-grasp enzyme